MAPLTPRIHPQYERFLNWVCHRSIIATTCLDVPAILSVRVLQPLIRTSDGPSPTHHKFYKQKARNLYNFGTKP